MARMLAEDFEVRDNCDGLGWTYPVTQRHYQTAEAAAQAAVEDVKVLLAQAKGQVLFAKECDDARVYDGVDGGSRRVLWG